MTAARRIAAFAAATTVAAIGLSSLAPAQAADRFGDPNATIGGPLLADPGVAVRGPALPPIHAKAWLVADVDTGDVLAAYHAHWRLRPASTLKTLTAVMLLPRLQPSTVYRAQYADAVVDGSLVGLVPGATYTVNDLFYGLFLPSGNDAAHALAELSGGVRHTVTLMQDEADHLQADDTHVVNPHGLDAPGQVTSAYDLALFARAGLARPDFRRYCSTITYAFPGRKPKKPGAKRGTYQIYNQNPMLVDGFNGAIGVKTGYTTLAGRTFVGAATRHGDTLVATLLGIRDSSAADAEALLSWGFRNGDRIRPVGQLVDPEGVTGATLGHPASAPVQPQISGVTAQAPHTLVDAGKWVLVVLLALAGTLWVRRRLTMRRRERARAQRQQRVLRH